MTLAIYAPFSWLILIDYPWNDYRWQWVIRWPALPMLLPAALLRRWFAFEIDSVWAIILMTIFSLLAIFSFAWFGAQRWRTLIVTGAIVLALSSLNAYVAYQLFAMWLLNKSRRG